MDDSAAAVAELWPDAADPMVQHALKVAVMVAASVMEVQEVAVVLVLVVRPGELWGADAKAAFAGNQEHAREARGVLVTTGED